MNQKQLFEKIQRIQQQLMHGLIEREQTIKLSFLATLSGEHILLIGPPGTGKSMVARRIHLIFKQTSYFERLLTRFSVPEELFGPLSIKALEQDQYTRLTQGYLPQATIAFLDEIFKANSAILNALLTLLNEREFDNGITREKVPLISVIGASNELPESEELGALFDRFLFRQYVAPVSRKGFKQLLMLKNSDQDLNVEQLSLEEIQFIQKNTINIELSAEVVNFLTELRKWCHENQIQVSDRRWLKIVHMLKVSAFTNGQSTVSIWDCWLVQHCIWEKPEQVELVAQMYEQYCGKAVINVDNLVKVVDALEGESKNTVFSDPVSKSTKNTNHREKKNYNDLSIPVMELSLASFGQFNEKAFINWYKELGDIIKTDDVIGILESGNKLIEIKAPVSGTISYLSESILDDTLCEIAEIERAMCMEMGDSIYCYYSSSPEMDSRLDQLFNFREKKSEFGTLSMFAVSKKSGLNKSMADLLERVYKKYPLMLDEKVTYAVYKVFQNEKLTYPAEFNVDAAFKILEESIA